jgi:hypothetical protein
MRRFVNASFNSALAPAAAAAYTGGVARDWHAAGVLTAEQARRIDAVESGRVFSLHRELRALLYLGVVLIAAGVGATVARHFQDIGESAVVLALAAAVAGCFGWCFRRAAPYAAGKAQQPSAALDYLLYLGCALTGVLLSYLESRHHFLGARAGWYLLPSGLASLALAYRFDNRLVLSLGLVNLAAWWGVEPSRWGLPLFGWEPRAFLFGAGALAAALGTARSGIKAHFEDAYLVAGVHAVFWSLLPRALGGGAADPRFWLALVAAAACIAFARRTRRFQYLLYGAGYGYITALRGIVGILGARSFPAVSLLFLLSAGGAVAFLLRARREFLQGVE